MGLVKLANAGGCGIRNGKQVQLVVEVVFTAERERGSFGPVTGEWPRGELLFLSHKSYCFQINLRLHS